MTLLVLSSKGTLMGSPLLGVSRTLAGNLNCSKMSVALGNVAQFVECWPHVHRAQLPHVHRAQLPHVHRAQVPCEHRAQPPHVHGAQLPTSLPYHTKCARLQFQLSESRNRIVKFSRTATLGFMRPCLKN